MQFLLYINKEKAQASLLSTVFYTADKIRDAALSIDFRQKKNT